jgi:hypothetical protein
VLVFYFTCLAPNKTPKHLFIFEFFQRIFHTLDACKMGIVDTIGDTRPSQKVPDIDIQPGSSGSSGSVHFFGLLCFVCFASLVRLVASFVWLVASFVWLVLANYYKDDLSIFNNSLYF